MKLQECKGHYKASDIVNPTILSKQEKTLLIPKKGRKEAAKAAPKKRLGKWLQEASQEADQRRNLKTCPCSSPRCTSWLNITSLTCLFLHSPHFKSLMSHQHQIAAPPQNPQRPQQRHYLLFYFSTVEEMLSSIFDSSWGFRFSSASSSFRDSTAGPAPNPISSVTGPRL